MIVGNEGEYEIKEGKDTNNFVQISCQGHVRGVSLVSIGVTTERKERVEVRQ
jgi:hypothetical protein